MKNKNEVLAKIKQALDTDPDFAEGFQAYKDGKSNSENPYPHPSNLSAMHIAWAVGFASAITEETILNQGLTPCGR